jgi:hypothetical protein
MPKLPAGQKTVKTAPVKSPEELSKKNSYDSILEQFRDLVNNHKETQTTLTLTELTESRARSAASKVLEAAVEGLTKTVNQGRDPSESDFLLAFVNEFGKILDLEISAKFETNHALEVARLRGEVSKLELLGEAGPMLTIGQAAETLGKTKQAVHKRLQSGSLFGIMSKGEFRIPAWQIREREVVPGIGKVINHLDTTEWGKMLFLHSENMQLGGRKPMDLILAGDVDSVAAVASSFGEQGAK